MKRAIVLTSATLFGLVGTALALQDTPAADVAKPAAPAPDADAMLKEFRSVEMPAFDPTKREDSAYIQKYIQQRNETMGRKADLAWKFYESHPKHAQAIPLLVERWQTLAMTGKAASVPAEAERVLKDVTDAGQKGGILFARAQAMLMDYRALMTDPAPAAAATEAFIAAMPKDERGAHLLARLADTAQDPAKKVAYLKRVREGYPTSSVARMAEGQMRQAEGVGKPFELSFTDAINGKEVSMKDLKGKVVVIDFWATWCGPCIAEMPNMKKLYAEYKDKGVEFIGVSLDAPEAQGGLEKLKAYCAKENIPWPQYYQGKGWESEFSGSWGINGIPALFIVDADGNLHSTQARGQLETLIPELIAKRDAKKVTLLGQ